MRPIVYVFLATAILVSVPAEATVWTFDCQVAGTCPSSNGAGKMIASVFSFDDQSLDFSWAATFEPNSGRTPDGVWFVINHGPEPSDSDKGLAIFYGAKDTGRVSAYVYDDGEGKDSWDTPGIFLATYPNGISFTTHPNGNVSFLLSLNVAPVNGAFPADPKWQGLFFQDTIGFWAAALNGTDLELDANGRILDFSFRKRTSYDRSDRKTTFQVPEPSLALLFGVGLAWIARRRREL